MKALAWAAALLVAMGCGGASTDEAARPSDVAPGSVAVASADGEAAPEGDAGGRAASEPPPTPPLPFAADEASPAMQRALESAARVYALPRPEQPAEASLDSVNAWAREVFTPWVMMRTEQLASAREDLEALREAPPAEQVVAMTLLALLWADLSRDLSEGTAVPDEVRDDAELRRIYLGALHEQGAPFRQRAIQLLERCNQLATEHGASLSEWADFCEQQRTDVARWNDGPPLEPTSTAGTWRPSPRDEGDDEEQPPAGVLGGVEWQPPP